MEAFDKPKKRRFVLYTAGDYNHTPSTGGTRRYREMLEYFLEAGDEVYLLSPKNVNLQYHENLHQIPVRAFRSKFFPSGVINYIFNRKSFRIVKQLRTDGVVLFSVPYVIQAILAGLKNINLFIREDIEQNVRFRAQNGSCFIKLKLIIYRLIERYTLIKVRKIIVQSNYAKNLLKCRHPALWKNLEKKTYVLPNNVNASWMLRYSNYIRQKPLSEKKVFHFLFIGSINTRIKGLHLLLNAVRYLQDDGFPVHLDVFGDGKLKSEYKLLYKDYNRIIFRGWVNEPMEVLSNYELLIVPSLSDAFPNVVLEALFMEIPVIGSNAGGIPEILYYPELLFKPDERNLAEKLRKIIENDQLENLRQKCLKRKRALDFNWGEKLREIVSQ